MAQEHGVIRGIARVLGWALAVGVFVAAGAMTAGMPVLQAATHSVDVTLVAGKGGAMQVHEWAFVPNDMTVHEGDTLKVTNTGQVPHDLVIDGLVNSHVINPHQTASILINLKPGTYAFYCSQPAHRQMGMYGVLKVE